MTIGSECLKPIGITNAMPVVGPGRTTMGPIVLGSTIDGDTSHLSIIGVMEDFHHSSLMDPVGPYMLRYKDEDLSWPGYINIRLGVAGKGIPITISKIKGTWLEMTGNAPFQFFFLEDELNSYYSEERRTGRLSFLFAALTTFIACLGLFGLTLHHAHRRTREIGIRKAMGASIKDVIKVLSREVIQLMGISILFAWIASYVFMQNWLKGFPFHIGFKAWIYLVSALSAMLLALVSVTLLAYRAARRNPASTLHYE